MRHYLSERYIVPRGILFVVLCCFRLRRRQLPTSSSYNYYLAGNGKSHRVLYCKSNHLFQISYHTHMHDPRYQVARPKSRKILHTNPLSMVMGQSSQARSKPLLGTSSVRRLNRVSSDQYIPPVSRIQMARRMIFMRAICTPRRTSGSYRVALRATLGTLVSWIGHSGIRRVGATWSPTGVQ